MLLSIASFFLVSHIADITYDSVTAEVESLVQQESIKVESYFEKYGHVAKTFSNNPMFLNGFENYPGRSSDLSSYPAYAMINQTFKQVSGADVNIISAFFGLTSSDEYFREDDRTGDNLEPDYYISQRPWYQEAMKKQDFFVASPSSDLTTGLVSGVIEGKVYSTTGELMGVAGLDIDLGEIGKMIDQLQYQNKGLAFLLDDKANVVHFPQVSGSDALAVNQTIADLDKRQDTTGFAELAQAAQNHQSSFTPITFDGEDYFAVFQPTHLDFPEMDWTIGILIPAHLVTDQSNAAIQSTVLAVIVILLILGAVILYVASRITRPITALTEAMRDIAEGEGDLTKVITIESNDEVGVLASHFNTFLGKLRGLLQQTAIHAETVNNASVYLDRVQAETNKQIQQEKSELDMVSTAVTEMAVTVLEISRNANETNAAASEAQQQTSSCYELSSDSMAQMDQLLSSMQEAVDVVAGLGNESKNIGAVVDVINGIAEQTNLLALNAAIEAARAGEQGRGFAVVADEVRSLASRTQESTKDIRNMVERLQSMAKNAENVMQQGKQQTEAGVAKTQQVQQALSAINSSISTVQDQSSQIAVATNQQTVVAESINESLCSVTQLADETAQHASDLSIEAVNLHNASDNLNEVVGSFKI